MQGPAGPERKRGRPFFPFLIALGLKCGSLRVIDTAGHSFDLETRTMRHAKATPGKTTLTEVLFDSDDEPRLITKIEIEPMAGGYFRWAVISEGGTFEGIAPP